MSEFPKFLEGKNCANCKLLIPIYCHPWNEKIGKGAITEPLGFICTLFEKYIFQEANRVDTSICECHTPKEKTND